MEREKHISCPALNISRPPPLCPFPYPSGQRAPGAGAARRTRPAAPRARRRPGEARSHPGSTAHAAFPFLEVRLRLWPYWKAYRASVAATRAAPGLRPGPAPPVPLPAPTCTLLGSPPPPPLRYRPGSPYPGRGQRRISGFALAIKRDHLRLGPGGGDPGTRLGGGGWEGGDVPPPLRREVISRPGSLWMLGSSEAGAPERHGLRRERLSRGSPPLLTTLSVSLSARRRRPGRGPGPCTRRGVEHRGGGEAEPSSRGQPPTCVRAGPGPRPPPPPPSLPWPCAPPGPWRARRAPGGAGGTPGRRRRLPRSPVRRRSWPRLWRSCGGQVSPGGRPGKEEEAAGCGGGGKRPGRRRRSPRCPVRRRPPRSRGKEGGATWRAEPPGGEGQRAAGATLCHRRRCGVAAPRRRGGAAAAAEAKAPPAPAAPRPGGSPGSPAGRGPGRPRRGERGGGGAASPPAPRTCARRGGGSPGPAGRGARPRAEGKEGLLSSPPPRRGPQPRRRSCFRTPRRYWSLDEARFGSSLPTATKSGLSAGCRRVPCGRSARPGVGAARSRGARPGYLTGGPRGRRLRR